MGDTLERRGETMALSKVTVIMTPEEKAALIDLARADLRDPREHLRWLLREEAERRGMWPPAPIKSEVLTPCTA